MREPAGAKEPVAAAQIPAECGSGFTQAFMARMLFSCLVDADFLETERFYAEANDEKIERGGHTELHILRDRLRAHMAQMQERAKETPVNALRARVLDHAIQKAGLGPGLFTLTVPTGGGKTLASLSFALEHAVRHGLQRVIYVIPFTGAWIETRYALACPQPTWSLPSRERGSKHTHGIAPRNRHRSLPSRSADRNPPIGRACLRPDRR